MLSLLRFDGPFKYFFQVSQHCFVVAANLTESYSSSSALQHPYTRLLVCCLVMACNLLLFAEDPVSHSKRGKTFLILQEENTPNYPRIVSEADIPILGNVFSFMFTKHPPGWQWKFLKVRYTINHVPLR